MKMSAETAKEIRFELKITFKGVKFKILSENFSGGDAVRIGWENGPTTDQVDSIVNKYQYGSFNSHNDIYEYDNKNDLPQVKYIQTDRTFTNNHVEA